MSEIIYLGRVKWVRENPVKNYRHATIEPIIRSTEDQSRWLGSIESPLTEFPARGFINWHDAPRQLEVGDIKQFDIQPHPFYSGEPDREAYQVRTHKDPTEIIDLRNTGSEQEIRVLLTNKGVFLSDKPLFKRCVLWVSDEKWVGPVDLVNKSGTRSWVIGPEQELSSLRCWKMPSESVQQVELDGTRYFLIPKQENLGLHIGFLNWEADEVLAKRVFKHLLKRDPATAKALEITKKIFNAYVEQVEQAGLIGAQLEQELAFRERIQETIEVISKNDELLNEAADTCFAIGPLKSMMEERAEEEYQQKLEEKKGKLNEELEAINSELKLVEKDLVKKNKQLSSIDKKTLEFEKKLQERAADFDAELGKKMRDIAQKPEAFFADMAIAKALFSSGESSLLSNKKIIRQEVEIDKDPDAPVIEESGSFMGALSTRLMGAGVSPVVGQMLHSTFMAGHVPVLIGPEAYDVVSCYADCVSGGKVHWIPVGGSLLEPSDILARFDPLERNLVPHAGGLLDLLLNDSDEMRIVFLDGFNRASVDSYLIPLLHSARDVSQGRAPRSIPVAPPGLVCEESWGGDVSRVSWNPNVLLVLCPSSGASSLPVPSDLWLHCNVIDVEAPSPIPFNRDGGPDPQVSRVSGSVWRSWCENSFDIDSINLFREYLTKVDKLPFTVVDKIENVCVMGESLGLDPEIALDQAFKMGLLPYLIVSNKNCEEWSRLFRVDLNDSDMSIGDAVRRLGE